MVALSLLVPFINILCDSTVAKYWFEASIYTLNASDVLHPSHLAPCRFSLSLPPYYLNVILVELLGEQRKFLVCL